MIFNKEQAEAIRHGAGPCMVLAPPGSGKTMVVTHRIRYLIENLKVPSDKILVITFTRLAAREMRERFEALTKGMGYPVTFGTFHSVFYGILKQEYGLCSSNLLSENESKALLKHILNFTYVESEITTEDEDELINDLAQEIGMVKNGLYSLQEFRSRHLNRNEFEEVFRAYEKEKKKQKKFDFDDMLVHTYALFKKYPDVLNKWQKKFQYILVDEFQDINKVQYEVIRMLGEPEKNLFIVGDDDQSIYGFRGSSPEFMQRLPKDYSGMKILSLITNYRSTEYIIGASSRVILHNHHRFRKKIQSVNGKGSEVHIQELKDESEEAVYVANEMERLLESGIEPCEIAILYRAGIQARMLTETLKNRNLPFQMKEYIPNFYKHFIVKDFMAYMQLACGRRDRNLFLMICNRPLRYISRSCVQRSEVFFDELRNFYGDKEWMQDIIDQLDIDIRMMEKMTPYAAVQYIMKRIGYGDFIKKYAEEQKIPEEQLLAVVTEFAERCKLYPSYEELFHHVKVYTEELEQQGKERSYGKGIETDKIQLMTMHAAKGLEFSYVFIIHANEGETPYQKADTPEEMEEERRMFYVAMTRAKKKLILSYVVEKNGIGLKPSRFVNEILGQTR